MERGKEHAAGAPRKQPTDADKGVVAAFARSATPQELAESIKRCAASNGG